jgi:hypothetical protein
LGRRAKGPLAGFGLRAFLTLPFSLRALLLCLDAWSSHSSRSFG